MNNKKTEEKEGSDFWAIVFFIVLCAFAIVGLCATVGYSHAAWVAHHDQQVQADDAAWQQAKEDKAVTTYFNRDPNCATANFQNLYDPQCVIHVGEIKTLTDRLNAIDGGKTTKWSCDDPNAMDPNAEYGEYQWHFEGMTPPGSKVVVQTIGYESPKQLGYKNCQAIPAALEKVVVAPVNQ